MEVVIPTYGRSDVQVTLRSFMAAGIPVHLVVQKREAERYQRWKDAGAGLPLPLIYELPDHIRTIAPTRDWIIQNVGSSKKIVMVDDDLTFYVRRDDDRTKFSDAHPLHLRHMMGTIESRLSDYAHVGIAAREGANRNTEQYLENTRIMRLLGYRRDVLKKECIAFDTMEVMEDFHVALSLLELGYPNLIVNDFCHNQAGSGKSGGCSHFRTKELQAENARLLASRHPRFVKVVEKTTKGAWGGGTRTDVTIQWKSAYAVGESNYGSRVLD